MVNVVEFGQAGVLRVSSSPPICVRDLSVCFKILISWIISDNCMHCFMECMLIRLRQRPTQTRSRCPDSHPGAAPAFHCSARAARILPSKRCAACCSQCSSGVACWRSDVKTAARPRGPGFPACLSTSLQNICMFYFMDSCEVEFKSSWQSPAPVADGVCIRCNEEEHAFIVTASLLCRIYG